MADLQDLIMDACRAILHKALRYAQVGIGADLASRHLTRGSKAVVPEQFNQVTFFHARIGRDIDLQMGGRQGADAVSNSLGQPWGTERGRGLSVCHK